MMDELPNTPLSPRELKLVLDEREECAKVAADFASAPEWIHSTTNYTAPMIAAAIRSRPQPSAPEGNCGNIPQLPPALGELIGRLEEAADRVAKRAMGHDAPALISIPRAETDVDAIIIEATRALRSLSEENASLRHDIERHVEIAAQQATENERLTALLDKRWKDALLVHAGPDGRGAFQFAIQHDLAGIIAEHLLKVMTAEGGVNFVELEANHEDAGPITFSIARRNGRSAAAQLTETKAENERLREALRPFITQKDGSLVDVFDAAHEALDDDVLCEREVTLGDVRRARSQVKEGK